MCHIAYRPIAWGQTDTHEEAPTDQAIGLKISVEREAARAERGGDKRPKRPEISQKAARYPVAALLERLPSKLSLHCPCSTLLTDKPTPIAGKEAEHKDFSAFWQGLLRLFSGVRQDYLGQYLLDRNSFISQQFI